MSALIDVRLEVRRCQANVAAGGDRAFWVKRLGEAAKQYEEAAAILRKQIVALATQDTR